MRDKEFTPGTRKRTTTLAREEDGSLAEMLSSYLVPSKRWNDTFIARNGAGKRGNSAHNKLLKVRRLSQVECK